MTMYYDRHRALRDQRTAFLCFLIGLVFYLGVSALWVLGEEIEGGPTTEWSDAAVFVWSLPAIALGFGAIMSFTVYWDERKNLRPYK
jgi:hypothetical protein